MGTIYDVLIKQPPESQNSGMAYCGIKEEPGILSYIFTTQMCCLFRAFAFSNVKQRTAGYHGITVGLLGIS